MATWTINNLAPADLHIEDIFLSFVNMDNDVATLRFVMGYSGEIPAAFIKGQKVAIALDGVQVFYGESQGPVRSGVVPNEGISVECLGGWYELDSVALIAPVTDSLTQLPFDSADPTFAGGTIRSQVEAILAIALASTGGAHVLLGTIDLPTMTVPSATFSSTTVAQALKSVLKWVPGVQVVFDYSSASATVKTAVHVLQLSSASLSVISQTDVLSLNWKKREDMLPTGVKIIYQRSGSWTTREYNTNDPLSSTDTARGGSTLVASESVGTVTPSRRAIIATVNLSGSKSILYHRYTIKGPCGHVSDYTRPVNWAVGVTLYQYIGNLLQAFNCPGITYTQKNWVSVPYYFWCPNSSYPLCKGITWSNHIYEGYASGNYDAACRWFITPDQTVPTSMRVSSVVVANQGLFCGFAGSTLTSQWSSDWTAAPTYTHTFVFPIGSFAWLWNGNDMEPDSFFNPAAQTIAYSATALSSDAESASLGLAAKYYELLQTIYNQGSLSKIIEAIDPLARVVSLNGIRTPVQRVTIQAARMTLDGSFGPPDHLQPQDLFSLLRAVTGR